MEQQVVDVASADVGCKTTGNGVFLGVPLCTLMIPNSLLLQLHEKNGSYVEGISANIKGNIKNFDKSSARLESSVHKVAGKLSSKLKNCKGSRDRARTRGGFSNFLVGEGEVETISAATEHLKVCVCVHSKYCYTIL